MNLFQKIIIIGATILAYTHGQCTSTIEEHKDIPPEASQQAFKMPAVSGTATTTVTRIDEYTLLVTQRAVTQRAVTHYAVSNHYITREKIICMPPDFLSTLLKEYSPEELFAMKLPSHCQSPWFASGGTCLRTLEWERVQNIVAVYSEWMEETGYTAEFLEQKALVRQDALNELYHLLEAARKIFPEYHYQEKLRAMKNTHESLVDVLCVLRNSLAFYKRDLRDEYGIYNFSKVSNVEEALTLLCEQRQHYWKAYGLCNDLQGQLKKFQEDHKALLSALEYRRETEI